jgi:hypothetical protein
LWKWLVEANKVLFTCKKINEKQIDSSPFAGVMEVASSSLSINEISSVWVKLPGREKVSDERHFKYITFTRPDLHLIIHVHCSHCFNFFRVDNCGLALLPIYCLARYRCLLSFWALPTFTCQKPFVCLVVAYGKLWFMRRDKITCHLVKKDKKNII